ncbi:hypothetical protein AM609_01245 [Actinomyces sp. oral taxon 414]|uniref:hypothetical protein n=1 Tax=Actinomyces sp. oral taxon 414 TaxID=712122 RepID=UPI0006AF3A5A|nr:hypothetical protein [Actinomyces sp. oral taxon 414]ALC98440.1 hypothetical protein AM609_01245 [Actinomyces sp. oral taxon 414]
MSTDSPVNTKPAAAPAPTIEEMEAALVARRERLAVDMEVLGTCLAPEALKARARDTARDAADRAKDSARSAAALTGAAARDAADRARVAARDAAADAGRSIKSAIAGLRPGSGRPGPAQHLTRLLNDARDGDPRSLAIVTGAAMALAGLSVVALVKAVRS